MIRGPFFPNRDTDPATCRRCGAAVTRGDLYGVADRGGRVIADHVCHTCALSVPNHRKDTR